jgi:hypothetical protein
LVTQDRWSSCRLTPVLTSHSALVLLFAFLNKLKEKERVRNGKPAKLVDRSMNAKYVQADSDESGQKGANGPQLGGQAFLDLTDRENDEVRDCKMMVRLA